MIRLLDYIKKSIKRRITAMMIVSFIPILIGAVIVPWSTFKIVNNYDNATRTLSENQKQIAEIATHTNEIILRVRGYFAYVDKYEYEQIFQAKNDLDKSVSVLESRALSQEERDLVDRVQRFFNEYLIKFLPQAAAFAEQGDYESLRALVTTGASNPVNEIILYANKSENQIRMQITAEHEKLFRNLILQGVYFIIYIISVLLLSVAITRRLSRDIGKPLQQLSQYARNYTNGETILPEISNRKDEIGHLSRSLNSMIYEIKESEEELLAQNEELQSQQDELETQQDELQKALSKMEENEIFLNKRNSLNQSLSNTLDKRELLDSIIRNVVEITKTDKGILLLMNELRDHTAYGISQEETTQFLDGFDQSLAIRTLYSMQFHLRVRDATLGERGYISGEVHAYDMFIPFYKANGDIMACMALTRVGRAIDKREEQEILDLVGQISLSLEKLEIFEAAEEQRQITQDMLNTIQEGVQLMNLEGQSLQVNKKFCELMDLSYEDSDLKGMPFNDFMVHLDTLIEDPTSVVKYIEDALNSEAEHTHSMNYLLKNEESRCIQMYWEPIYHNKQKFGILLVHRDITKEHEVDRMKSEFVSTVSHELRTPLASILGFSELLIHRELKPERQRKYMSTIHQEAKRLTELVNDFLDLQRMESGIQFYDLQPLNIMDIVGEVKDLQQAATDHHSIILNTSQEQVTVLGDRDKLFQVLINLVSNAIKYSPSGGEITISTRQEGNNILIDITDEGLGIPEHSLSDVFTKFFRVDNSDRRQIGGTGLGLAIVKEIVNRHQGEVSVQSSLGNGSTFSVVLPIYESTSVLTNIPNPVEIYGSSSLNVLLVENDRNLSVMLQDELIERGFRTTLCMDGNSAIQVMEDHPPDIVVLDLKLEREMTGWEVIEAMKSSANLQNIPIIISSAFEEKEKALQWGVSHFLIKPYISSKLADMIEDIMNIQTS
ncbi:ATP-binding response regulator [Paenibacillus sp. CMAA1364]